MSLSDIAPNSPSSTGANSLDDARHFLQSAGIDGWLTRDYRYTNPIFEAALGRRVEHLTRPVWLWIPANREPQLLAHEVDIEHFPSDSPRLTAYGNRLQMITGLKAGLRGAKIVAMEYSPLYELPRHSF